MLDIFKNKKIYIFFIALVLCFLVFTSAFYYIKKEFTLKNEMSTIQELFIKNYSRKKFVKNTLNVIDLHNKKLMLKFILNNFNLFLRSNEDLALFINNYIALYKTGFDELYKLKNVKGINKKDYKEIHKYLNKLEYKKIIDKLQNSILNNDDHILAQKNFFKGIVYELQFNLTDAENSYTKAIQLNATESRYYNNLGNIYYKLYKFDKSIETFNNGLNTSNFQSKKDKKCELELLKNLAKTYWIVKNLNMAFRTYSNLLVNSISSDNSNYEWLSVYNLAMVESLYGNYNVAIDYLKYSLKLAIKIKNNGYIAKSLNALSKIEYKYGDYENGKINGLKAIRYAKKTSNLGLIANASYNVCLNYELLDQKELALTYCNEAIKINNTVGRTLNRPEYYQNNGEIYDFISILRNYEESLKYFDIAYKISKEHGLLLNEISSLNGISEAEIMLNNFQDSINNLKKIENIENNLNVTTCKDCSYANIMWRKGKTKEAIKLFKNLISKATFDNNNLLISSIASNLAIIYYDNSDYDNALKYSTLALETNKKIYRYNHHYIKYQKGWQQKILKNINNKK